jgi:hypothetical protein
MKREELRGTWAQEREARLPSTRREELLRQSLEYGLESAESIRDRTISLPYDVADITSLLASRVIMDVLGTLVMNRKLGRIPPAPESAEQPK